MQIEVPIGIGDLLQCNAEHAKERLDHRREIVLAFDSNEEHVQCLRESSHEDEKDQTESQEITPNHRVDHHDERTGRTEAAREERVSETLSPRNDSYRQKKKKYGARARIAYTHRTSSRAMEHVNRAGRIPMVKKHERRNRTRVGSLT